MKAKLQELKMKTSFFE